MLTVVFERKTIELLQGYRIAPILFTPIFDKTRMSMSGLKVLTDENKDWLKVVSIDRPSFNIEPRIFCFQILKGHHPLNSIKLFLAFNAHKISFDLSNQRPLQKTCSSALICRSRQTGTCPTILIREIGAPLQLHIRYQLPATNSQQSLKVLGN